MKSATTLTDFYQQTVIDADDRQYVVADCAARARQALEVEEKRFADLVGCIGGDLSRKLHQRNAKDFTDQELFDEIKEWSDKLANSYQTDGVTNPDLSKDVFNSIYIHYGYIAARTLSYLGKPGAKYDVNDMEDGLICLHLSLNHNATLVTNDKGTFESVERAIRAFNQSPGIQSPSRCRVITGDNFLNEVGPH